MLLYIKPGCSWCYDAMDWLRERGIAFEALDVFADRAAYQRMREISGQTLAPTLEMPDGSVLADFGTDELEEFLAQHTR